MVARRSLVIAFALAACTAPAGEPVKEVARGIVGGTVDTGDMATVGLYFDGGWMCTGTLISSKIVLTAAHCVDPSPASGIVYFGSNMLDSDPYYLGQRNIQTSSKHPSYNSTSLTNDIGLIQLQYAPDASWGVTPKPINRTANLDPYYGDPVRLVGFGDTYGDAGDAGVKRQVTAYVTDTSNAGGTQFGYGDSTHNTCQGDSGGPNFMTFGGEEKVAGVTSYGWEGCTGGSYGTNVAYYATSFIDPWVASHDTVTCAGGDGCASGCPVADPDCPCADDGFCAACPDPADDPDCSAGCQSDGYCVASCPVSDPDCALCGANGTCILDCPTADPDCGSTNPCAANGECWAGCSPPDPDCSTTDPCAANGECASGCPAHDPDCPYAVVGDPCTGGADCATGMCIGALDDARIFYCSDNCDPAAPTCPAGMSCLLAPSGDHVCMWPTPTPGTIGTVCGTGADCASGLCIDTGGGPICIEYCSGDVCPSGWKCVASTSGNDVCVPDGSGGDEDNVEGGVCAIAGSRGAGGAGWALLLLALAVGFRSRRR